MTDKNKDKDKDKDKDRGKEETPLEFTVEVGNLDDLPEPILKEITEWQGLIRKQVDGGCKTVNWDPLCRILALFKYQIEAVHEVLAVNEEKMNALADGVLKCSANVHNLVEQLNLKWKELDDEGKSESEGDWWKR